MAKVPYSPIPDTAAGGLGAPMINPAGVSAEAFGGGIAAEMKGFGRELERAGDTLFNNVVSLKKDELETNVNEAVTKNLLESGEADNAFRQLQGKDPQENITGHKDNLKNIRESNRNMLKTDYERKMYDRETMRRFGYDVVNAGNYAATQMKRYKVESYEAAQTATAMRAIRDPFNDGYLKDAIEHTEKDEKMVSLELGLELNSPAVKNRIDQKVGKLIGDVAIARARRDPEGAMALLDKAEKEGKVPPNIYQQAVERITDRKIQYHATLDSRRLTGGVVLPERHIVTQNAPTITSTATQYGWDGEGSTFTPENIYRLVQQESKGRNLPPNEYGYTGYFQMKPSEFGKTPADFAKMSFNEQLELYAKRLKNLGYTGEQDLGMMNAAPKFANAPDTTVAYAAGSKEALANPQWVQYSAAGGAVTVGGIKAWAQAGGGGLGRTPEASLPEIAAKGQQLAEERFPGDPISQARYQEQLLANSQRNANLMRSQINHQRQQQRNAIDDVLYKIGPNERGPTSWEQAEQLRPGFMTMVEEAAKLNPAIVKHINDTFNYNAKMDVAPTPERYARYNEYKSLSYGLNPGDREKFLSTTPASLDLPRDWTSDIRKKQLEIQKKLKDVSKLREAMFNVTPLLDDYKIKRDPSSTSRTAKFNTFQGAFFQKLEDYEAKNKAFPDEKEQRAMAAGLLRQQESEYSWYDPRGYLYSVPKMYDPPSTKREEIIRDFKAENRGRDPTNFEIGIVYQRMLAADEARKRNE